MTDEKMMELHADEMMGFYSEIILEIRTKGIHVPAADYEDTHFGRPVVAKFYRMPNGSILGIKEWNGNEVIVPVDDHDAFNAYFPENDNEG